MFMAYFQIYDFPNFTLNTLKLKLLVGWVERRTKAAPYFQTDLLIFNATLLK